MTLRPSTAPQRVPLPSPPASSLPDGPDPESDSLRAASPTVTRFMATAVIDPLFESSAASALVAELVEFAAACRLDYAASLVAESVSAYEDLECFASPHLVSMLLAPEGDPDALDIPTPRSYTEAIEGPYSSQWQAAMDAEMASWKSTGTYVDEVPPPGANIVSGMWIFRVKRPLGSPPAFKARYVARGFSQQQGVDFFQTFSPTPKMTTLRVLLHVAAQRDYELHLLDFSTAFLQGSLHEEIWLRRPLGFTGSFPAGTQWSLWRPVYSFRQAPREWHDTLRTTLAALGFAPSTADPSLFLRTDATLPPFYVLVYVDDLVFATADTEALAHVKSELQKRQTCTDLGELTSYHGLRITRDRAQRTITLTQSHIVQQVLRGWLYFVCSSKHVTGCPAKKVEDRIAGEARHPRRPKLKGAVSKAAATAKAPATASATSIKAVSSAAATARLAVAGRAEEINTGLDRTEMRVVVRVAYIGSHNHLPPAPAAPKVHVAGHPAVSCLPTPADPTSAAITVASTATVPPANNFTPATNFSSATTLASGSAVSPVTTFNSAIDFTSATAFASATASVLDTSSLPAISAAAEQQTALRATQTPSPPSLSTHLPQPAHYFASPSPATLGQETPATPATAGQALCFQFRPPLQLLESPAAMFDVPATVPLASATVPFAPATAPAPATVNPVSATASASVPLFPAAVPPAPATAAYNNPHPPVFHTPLTSGSPTFPSLHHPPPLPPPPTRFSTTRPSLLRPLPPLQSPGITIISSSNRNSITNNNNNG
ncbi:unnamed protein product, partial [Closterium sp. NIES-53]